MTQEPDVFMRWIEGEAPSGGESLQQLMNLCVTEWGTALRHDGKRWHLYLGA